MSDGSIKKPDNSSVPDYDVGSIDFSASGSSQKMDSKVVMNLVKTLADIPTSSPTNTQAAAQSSDMSPQEKALIEMAQLLTQLQVLMSEMQQDKSKNTQSMSSTTIAIAQTNLQNAIKELKQAEKPTPWWEKLVEVVVDVVAVVVGALTGGPAGAMLAIGLVAAMQSGLFNKLMEAMVSAGAPQWLAQVVVFVAIVALTAGAGAADAASTAASNAAKTAAEEAVEGAVKETVETEATNFGTAAAKDAANDAKGLVKSFVKGLKNFTKVMAYTAPAAGASNMYQLVAKTMVENMPGLSDKEKKYLELTIEAVLTIIAFIGAFFSTPGATTASWSKLGGIGEKVGAFLQDNAGQLSKLGDITQSVSKGFDSAMGIQQGIIGVQQSEILKLLSSDQAMGELASDITHQIDDLAKGDSQSYGKDLQTVQNMMSQLLRSFNVGSSYAQAMLGM